MELEIPEKDPEIEPLRICTRTLAGRIHACTCLLQECSAKAKRASNKAAKKKPQKDIEGDAMTPRPLKFDWAAKAPQINNTA